jgi:NADPH:quinone reductase-like Zn-dependent oxidoreductase
MTKGVAMKALEIRDRWGLERLTLVERPEPEPGEGQVLLGMRAASLNYRDLLTVQGHYNPKQPLPLVPCSDGVGEVIAIGDGVSRVRVGDRVCPIFAQCWIAGEPTRDRLRSTLGGPLDGTLVERMVVDASGVVVVPSHLTDEEGAALPCAAVTAWSAVVTQARIAAGETVLVQGTGGVSIFALQFARVLGARVIVTSSSDEKLARARELGAWETINYKTTPKWGKRALELTDNKGVELVVEVGGSGTLAQSAVAVRFGGQISMIGVLAGGAGELNITPFLMKNVRVQGILVGHRDGFEAMNRAIATHELRPVVDRVFPWDQAREALERMAAGRHFGKICLRF